MKNPLPRHGKAFYPEGNTCLSRGENIPFKRLVQVSGTNSHRKRNVKKPPTTRVVLPITCHSSSPLFRQIHTAHLSLSSPTPPPQNCYPNAMICMEYLLTLQRDKLHMTAISYMTSCSLERHWDMKRNKIIRRTEWNRKCLYFSVVLQDTHKLGLLSLFRAG